MALNNCSAQVQAKIFDLYERGAWNPHVGVLDFVFSPANGAKLQVEMIGRPNGKNTQYSITYPVAVCTANVSSVVCTDAGAATEMTSCVAFSGFEYLSSGWIKADVSQFRDLGQLEVVEVMSHQASQKMKQLKADVSLAVLLAINTEAASGCIDGTTTTRTISLIDVNGAPVFNTDVDISADFLDAGFDGSPILLGNRQLLKYVNGIRNGAGNQYGQRVDTIDTFSGAYYDKNINATNTAPTTPGNEVMFAILPQLVNVISWSANVGIFATRSGGMSFDSVDPMKLVNTDNSTYMHTVLTDPASGMMFDFDIIYDAACKSFKWKLDTYYKVVILDLMGCKESCFNGIIKYDICPTIPVNCLEAPVVA